MSRWIWEAWDTSLRADDLARGHSWLHRLDPRTHVLVTGVYLLAVLSSPLHDLSRLILLAAFPVWTTLTGGIPLPYVARRIAVAAPWILLVALSWVWMDSRPSRASYAWPTAGDLAAVTLLLRLTLTVAAASLLLALTGVRGLASALLALRAPPLWVAQIWLLHRYAILLSEEATRLLRARDLRSSGRRLTWAQAGTLLGQLCVRALDRGDRVHRAMWMRGFDGHSLRAFEVRSSGFRAADLAYLGVTISWIVWARIGHGTAWLGRQLLLRVP